MRQFWICHPAFSPHKNDVARRLVFSDTGLQDPAKLIHWIEKSGDEKSQRDKSTYQ